MPVNYVGSPYHKRYHSPWGAARAAADSTECPPNVAPGEAARVLALEIEAAIVSSRCSRLRDGEWPRYAWGRSSFASADGAAVEVVWEARLTNHAQAQYKAYPVSRGRHSQLMPEEVREVLWPTP